MRSTMSYEIALPSGVTPNNEPTIVIEHFKQVGEHGIEYEGGSYVEVSDGTHVTKVRGTQINKYKRAEAFFVSDLTNTNMFHFGQLMLAVAGFYEKSKEDYDKKWVTYMLNDKVNPKFKEHKEKCESLLTDFERLNYVCEVLGEEKFKAEFLYDNEEGESDTPISDNTIFDDKSQNDLEEDDYDEDDHDHNEENDSDEEDEHEEELTVKHHVEDDGYFDDDGEVHE